MSVAATSARMSLHDLARLKQTNEKIAMLTCYDASFARLLDHCGVDVLLIGDSLGMVVQGQTSTLPVTVADIAYHIRAVERGSERAFIIADMPWGSSQISPEATFAHAAEFLAAGAQMVKIEGGASMVATTAFLSERGIPVCAHLGLTPQSIHQLGGYRVQGKDDASAARLKSDANALAAAGASMVLLEAIPSRLAAEVTAELTIPTIGIGAGASTSGQVLVLYDMLNITQGKKPRFVKDFMQGAASITDAVSAYVAAVKQGRFPGPEHGYG